MKHYTIKINNSNNGINFRNNTASKSLDDLILSNMIKMNPYLEKKEDTTLTAMLKEAGFTNDSDRIIISNRKNDSILKGNFDIEFANAAKFLSEYTPTKKYITFGDTPIAFFEDEIQIGDYLIPLYKLNTPRYYNLFDDDIKKLIINIFITIKG